MNADGLVEAREKLLRQALERFTADSRVIGVFLGGSLGAGTEDAFSDIDLRVVVAHEAHERFVANRQETPKQWDGFLFNEWMPGAQHCVSHFRPFCKIDVFYHDASTLRPSPWYGLPTKILYDPQGFLRDLVAQSQARTFEVDLDRIDWLVSKGLAAAHEVYRRAKRGELMYAENLLDELRLYMVEMDDWVNGRTPVGFCLKQEERLTPDLLQALRSSCVPAEPQAILAALRGLLPFLQSQVAALHTRFNLARPLDCDLASLNVLSDV